MPLRDEQKSIGELFADLSRDTSTLIRKEVELARTEMTAKFTRLGRHAAFIAVGGAIAYAGLLVILGACVILLQLAGLAWWAAALIVGIVVALAGYLFVQRGLAALSRENLAPTETIASLKESAEWAKGQRT